MAGISLEWDNRSVLAETRRECLRRLFMIAEQLEAGARANLAKEGQPNHPRSAPGESPRYESKKLYESVYGYVDPGSMTVSVGTDEPYGYWLEHGTVGGKTIYPSGGKKWLTWVDERTNQQVFAKSVTLGAIKPRPWLSRTMEEQEAKIRRIWETGRY